MRQANVAGILLPDEVTADLQGSTAAESARQAASFRLRSNRRRRLELEGRADPPRPSELLRQTIYIDRGAELLDGWGAAVARHEASS